MNRKESIRLPNTFRSKTPKGKKEAFKVTIKTLQAESQTVSSLKNGQSKTDMSIETEEKQSHLF